MNAKLARTILCGIAGWLIACGPRPAVAQTIAAPLLADLKAATVFVKVNRRTLDWSGSGFVIQKSKGAALIITNAHVLQCPKIDDAEIAKNLPKETMKMIIELQKEVSGVESTANVVFSSGTPEEVVLPAEIVAQDDVHDLAVLKVQSVPGEREADQTEHAKNRRADAIDHLGFSLRRDAGHGQSQSDDHHHPRRTDEL